MIVKRQPVYVCMSLVVYVLVLIRISVAYTYTTYILFFYSIIFYGERHPIKSIGRLYYTGLILLRKTGEYLFLKI